MLDAAVAVYHVKDWISAMHPGYKVAAEDHARGSLWILLCRDICHASKHVGLNLESKPYVVSPQAGDYVDYTLSASVGTYAGLPILKVFSTRHGNYYAPDVIRNAIADWETFFVGKNIP